MTRAVASAARAIRDGTKPFPDDVFEYNPLCAVAGKPRAPKMGPEGSSCPW